MQEAIRFTQELKAKDDATQEEKDTHMERLKPEINNLLHTYLPDNVTIKDADILAMVIVEMVWNPDTFLNPSKQ